MGEWTPEAGPADGPPEARALARFLAAEPDTRHALAPRVSEAVGRARLDRIVEATLTRTGTPVTVTDSPDGLLVTGPRGTVRAWARTTPQDADGRRLTALAVEPATHEPARPGAGRLARLPYLLLSPLPFLFPAWTVLAVWTTADRTSWLAATATLAAFFVVLAGLGAPAQRPRLLRRTVAGLGLAAVLSACRLPSLPAGHDVSYPLVSLALLAVALAATAQARTHRWGSPVSRPLRFPLEGTWYVVQGGGRLTNHHTGVPEQRGAVDLTGLGPYGTRSARDRADVTAYAAYGRPVFAPCRGRVVSAADGIEDQRPGTVRYQPLYGNHVFIDTAREVVKLAHLRPGSLRVRAGDEVEPGQLLGEVGNSGNSTEPHLHLHAERDGVGLDLTFGDVPGRLYRGRRIRAPRRVSSSGR